MGDSCEHRDTDTYYHTAEDGTVTERVCCLGCGVEVG